MRFRRHRLKVRLRYPKEGSMLKVLFLFPLLICAAVFCLVGGLFLLPALVLLPVLAAIGIGVFAITIVFSLFGLALRLAAGLVMGVGGLLIAILGFVLFAVGGGAILALGFVAAHLLMPILLIAGIIWLIHHFARPRVPLQIQHDRS
jgi:hypothetical protein